MSKYRQNLGNWGENAAENFLVSKGHLIVGRNVRTPYGEIDIISRDGDILVFVEVKTRSNEQFGLPEEAITRNKQIHMLNAAQAFLQTNPDFDGDWRIDVIAVRKKPGVNSPEIIHFENVLF